jgi:Rrf2 family protein
VPRVAAASWSGLHISARSDLAVRALLQLVAAVGPSRTVKSETIAARQEVPVAYALSLLLDLRRRGLVTSHRGAGGGFRLSRPADAITVGDVVRAIDGPCPDERIGPGVELLRSPSGLGAVWAAVQATVWSSLDSVTLADVAASDRSQFQLGGMSA